MNIFDRIISIVEDARQNRGGMLAAFTHLLALQRLAWNNMTVAQKENLLTSKPLTDMLLACGTTVSGQKLFEEYQDWLLETQDDLEDAGYRFEQIAGTTWIWESPEGEGSEDFDSIKDAVEDAYLHLALHKSANGEGA